MENVCVLMSEGDDACKFENGTNTVIDLIVILSFNTVGTDEDTSCNAFIQNSELFKHITRSCTRDGKCRKPTFRSWKVRKCKA